MSTGTGESARGAAAAVWRNDMTEIEWNFRVQTKKLSKTAILPSHGSDEAAGYDLYADMGEQESVTIQPHSTMKISTGLAMHIPSGFFGAIFARSGIAAEQGLRPANCVGVIDSDYRGEIKVALHNDTDTPQLVANGSRVAQLVILPCWPVQFDEVNELNCTARGAGGFGSTGIGKEDEHARSYKQLSLFDVLANQVQDTPTAD